MAKFLLISVFLFGAYWFFLVRKGKIRFWKLVAKYSDKSYQYFLANAEAWYVCDTDSKLWAHEKMRELRKDFKGTWTGPFRLYVPSIDRIIHIYGKSDKYEAEQEKLVKVLKD